MTRHILSLLDLSSDEILQIFERAAELKAKMAAGQRPATLPGRVLALLFEKPSLRTRVSFEAAFAQLGGSSLYLGADVGWGQRESTADFSRVLSQYVDVVVCRSKRHESVVDLAQYASCPVINGLTDQFHPCQALTDLFTLWEIDRTLEGRRLAYVGDANNVARSLALACGLLSVEFAIASPTPYRFDANFVEMLRRECPNLSLLESSDALAAVAGSDAVYTDVWASMGQESERNKRASDFAAYQVNAELMSAAPGRAKFMHCLPARRGEEVTDEVIDSEQSVVVEQAANRMHLQKGLLAWLLA